MIEWLEEKGIGTKESNLPPTRLVIQPSTLLG